MGAGFRSRLTREAGRDTLWHIRMSQFAPAPAFAQKPSRLRYTVLAYGVGLAGLTYLDRVCISILAKDIMHDLRISEVQMGIVFSAFTLAYALFEVPTAWWAERVGSRGVLARIVAWWSLFTMATAAVTSYTTLLVTRFLFGVGEAGAFPCMARAFASWIPATERGRVQGLFWMGGHFVGGITPALVTALLVFLPWRGVFLLFGAIGFIWVAAWYRFFRDDPAAHPRMTPGELEIIRAGRPAQAAGHGSPMPWRRLFASRSVLGLCLMYFTQGYGFYFYITWLPSYLQKSRGFSSAAVGLLAGMPLLFSVAADLAGGLTTDWVTRRWGLRAGRSLVGGCAFLVAGVALIAGAATTNGLLAAVLIGIAGASPHFALACSWGACMDIGGRNAGVVSACMNTAGQLAGVASPIVLALILRGFSNWAAPLYLTGILYLLGALCWTLIDPRRPLAQAEGDTL